ncbi:MAG TPA: hypothetical protein VEY07_02770 [Thermoplasmata archaeon]|nr:hypothetical protein [Thermoplasmata archaeon]
MGTVPSSRLTKILQEKAALLKKQRESAETALHEVQERIGQLEAIEIVLPGAREKEAQILELVRHSDWPAVEAQSKALHEQIVTDAGSAFEGKRKQIAERGDRLVQFGLPLPDGFSEALAGVAPGGTDEDWSRTVGRLTELDKWIHSAQAEFSAQLRTRARGYAEWAGETPGRLAELEGLFRTAVEPVTEGKLAEGQDRINRLLVDEVPEGAKRREAARSMGAEILAAGRDLGVPTTQLGTALQADAESPPIDWPRTVVGIEGEAGQLADALREKVAQVVQALGRTLESVREYDVDPTPSLVIVEDVGGKVPTAGPADLPRLLQTARAATEEPVVGIVASLLDSVRPKLVEARRLGRDATEVFSAMNRAREALRLKIYSEALAASQEAADRVAQLTAELDSARSEADSLRDLLGRLATSRFPTAIHAETLDRIASMLDRVELEPARQLLAETIRRLGAETVAYFSDRFAALERVILMARERSFLPPDTEAQLARARQLLENGQLAEAAEQAASVEVALRTAAGPYVARRVEELESGFKEIPDESLVAPVRRLLADADVNLRVKEDLPGSIDSLRRAEREFSAVFAAHASTLVEMLEEERKVLEEMGGTGDEIQRQIDEVQQIFNMGDFVKASRTSQEIRTRAQQQQLVRSEDAVSHAKLALVELGKMGLEPGPLRSRLETAQAAARERRYADAFQAAKEVLDAAGRTKATAQRILDGMSETADLFQSLKESGISVDAYREQLRLTRIAYQALDFDGALAQLESLSTALAAARAEAEARRLSAEAQLLSEDAERLGLDTGTVRSQLTELDGLVAAGKFAEAEALARSAHGGLIQLLRPVLSDHLRTIEQDFEVARSTGVDAPDVAELLGDARRRLGLPVPSGVAEVLERARSKLVESRGFLEHAERGLRRARDALSGAELARVNVREPLDRLSVVEAALSRKEYAKVIELASTLEREMIQATAQQVGRTLAGIQATIARARHEGSDTTVAENLLRQARAALEEGRPLDSLQKAALAGGELERVELQLRIAEGSIQAMERKLTSAQEEGVRSVEADREIEQARRALSSHAYSDVLSHAIDLSEALDSARDGFRRSREALDAADRQVKEAMEMGADTSRALPALEAARAAHQSGTYGDSTRLARESSEAARWALERQYSEALADVRRLYELAQARGVPTGLESAEASLGDAEEASGARDWSRAQDALAKSRGAIRDALLAFIESRERAILPAPAEGAETSSIEAEARTQFTARVSAASQAGEFGGALDLIDAEEARLKELRQRKYQSRLAELKDRLWVGEKLGLDTTPVMELFSEAGLAVQASRFEPVDALLAQADERLRHLVRGRLDEKLDEVTTELNFAREGLHVSVEPVAHSLENVSKLVREGQVLPAAHALLDASEELNRRKALHRELMNLHYLIDAALARATERKVDTTPARALLEESIQLRASDYGTALAKAREALQLLQSQLRTTETATGFWALRRPPAAP